MAGKLNLIGIAQWNRKLQYISPARLAGFFLCRKNFQLIEVYLERGDCMSVENVKKFYEAVSKDASLKQKFVELSQKYQGQPMDEAKGMSVFEQEALPLAAQMGYSFTMDELKAYGEEMKQANMNCELSDEEMQSVVGGNGGVVQCPLIGVGSGDVSGFCFIGGSFRSSSGSRLTCVLVGEGMLY